MREEVDALLREDDPLKGSADNRERLGGELQVSMGGLWGDK